jgi:electron transfer flavoprotein beta subunit
MKGKKKPIDERTPADYGVAVEPRLTVVRVHEPATRKAGIKVGSVGDLVERLRMEAGVL